MRRREKEVTDVNEIKTYIQKSTICRLGFSVDNQPYIVPMSFGYDGRALYFHCAKEGKKLEMLHKNPQVCFELEADTKLVRGEEACQWTMEFISILGTGTASLIEEENGKKEALQIIMDQYAKGEAFTFSPKAVQAVTIIKVEIDQISCKKSGC